MGSNSNESLTKPAKQQTWYASNHEIFNDASAVGVRNSKPGQLEV